MRYLLLIYAAEQPDTDMGDAPPDEMDAYNAFTRDIRERGLFEGGEALHPTASATTVRVRDGEVVATDGPFAETKEALGGYYLINARDLDEAIETAAKIPGARYGSIEIRPIFEFAAAASPAGAGSAGASS